MTAQILNQKTTTQTSQKPVKGGQFLSLGLLCFLALGSEMLVVAADHMIWGNLMTDSWSKDPWFIIIAHWLMTMSLWSLSAWGIIKSLQTKGALADVLYLHKPSNYCKQLFIALSMLLLLTIIEPFIEGSQLTLVPQFIRETSKFVSHHGHGFGLLISIVQIAYYFVEAVLVMLLLSTMQRAGEIWFKSAQIPFGGIALMFTWGLAHLTKGVPAVIWLTAFTIITGLVFIRNHKSIWVIYPFILGMFLI